MCVEYLCASWPSDASWSSGHVGANLGVTAGSTSGDWEGQVVMGQRVLQVMVSLKSKYVCK